MDDGNNPAQHASRQSAWRAKSLPPRRDIQDYKGTLPPLPNELWLDIFTLASSSPGFDEFGIKPARHTSLVDLETRTTSLVDQVDLKLSLECRRQIVLVSQSWYRLARPLLWSHIRVRVTRISLILDPMRKEPRLGEYVRRISTAENWGRVTIVMPSLREEGQKLQEIIGLCPFVSVIQIPLLSAPTPYKLPETLRVLNVLWPVFYSRFPLLPQGLTSLYVSPSPASLPTTNAPEFSQMLPSFDGLPSLRALDMHEALSSSRIFGSVLKEDACPSLETLVVHGGNAHSVMEVVKTFATSLTTLKIYGSLRKSNTNGFSFRLPNLSHLQICAGEETVGCLEMLPPLSALRLVTVYQLYRLEIPYFDRSKEMDVRRFHAFFIALGKWCPMAATITVEGGEYLEWMERQLPIAEAIAVMRLAGRRLVLPSEQIGRDNWR